MLHAPLFMKRRTNILATRRESWRTERTILTNDLNRDARALTQDQQRLNALEIQAAEANVGKAPPLSPWQQNELVDLRRDITHLNQDIARDNQRRAVDELKIEAWH